MTKQASSRLTQLLIACIALLCILCCALPCAADEGRAHGGSVGQSGAATSASPAAPALPPASDVSSSTAAADDGAPAMDSAVNNTAAIERLLLKAEHARFGIAEGQGRAPGSRPRLSRHTFPAHPSLAHSLAANKRADVAAARALYTEAAALGSSVALNDLGEIALFGEAGSGTDVTAAEGYFNESAALGNPEAQHHLAVMNWLGLNEAGQSDEAAAMLNEYFSALGGNPLAKMALGYRHLLGLSAPQSCDAAVAYYQQVAEEVVAQSVSSPVNVVIEKARLADERARSVPPEEDEDIIQYYRHSAEHGDVQAQVALGHLHFFGARGFEQNAERAAKYFRAAAAQGDTGAMSSLGQMHVQGLGVPQNNDTAFRYLSEAANKHNAAAQSGLGYLYLHGQGTPQDYKMALKWFKKAADQGHAEAQFHLGTMYFAGLGVDKKYTTALQYFTLAGHAGHTRSLYNLGMMHLHGLGTIKSCAIGVKLHKSVAERGHWAAVLNEAHRNFLKGRYEIAWLQYARAAEEGFEVAQANSAWMLDQGLVGSLVDGTDVPAIGMSAGADASTLEATPAPRVSRRHLLAHRHWSMAAAQGNIDSLRVLGDYAFDGLVTGTPDYAAAIKFYSEAAEHRNAQAMFNLGYMHELGLGTSGSDFHLAKRFYDSCLESDSNALVPVKLALIKLYARAYWQEYFGGDEAGPAAAAGAASTSSPAASASASAGASPGASPGPRSVPSPAQTLPGPLEWVWKHVRATGVSEWLSKLSTANTAFELFLSVEDLLLALLCAALAVIVYMRSQR